MIHHFQDLTLHGTSVTPPHRSASVKLLLPTVGNFKSISLPLLLLQHFYPEKGGIRFLQSVGTYLMNYMASHTRRPHSSQSLPWESQLPYRSITLGWSPTAQCLSNLAKISPVVLDLKCVTTDTFDLPSKCLTKTLCKIHKRRQVSLVLQYKIPSNPCLHCWVK